MKDGPSNPLAAYRRETGLCSHCPSLCLFACPVSTARGSATVSPWAKMSLSRWVSEGRAPLDADASRVFHACLACLACRTPCKHEVEVGRVLLAARAHAVETGVAAYDVAAFLPDETAQHEKLRAVVPASLIVPETQVLVFAGCDTLNRYPTVLTDLLSAATILGVDYMAAGPASAMCCGYPLYASGHLAEFRQQAAAVQKALAPYRKIVVINPCCAYTLRVTYAELGFPLRPRIEHASTFLEPLTAAAAFQPLAGQFAYHDPCYLGRYLGVYEAPRRLLAKALRSPVHELCRQRSESPCCGGGGVLERTDPETSRRVAGTVLDQIRRLGVQNLATFCTRCQHQFATGAPDLSVMNVISLVAQALGAVGRAS